MSLENLRIYHATFEDGRELKLVELEAVKAILESELSIYTDGACKVHSTQVGGWAFVVDGGYSSGGWAASTTNNRMELLAVQKALQWCVDNNKKATIHCDSQYVVNGLTKWCQKWSRNNFQGKKEIKNKDLWSVTYPLYLKSGCVIKWVKGHSGNEGNDAADKLANYCMDNKLEVV